MTTKQNESMKRAKARLKVPVGLGEAEQLLAAYYPRWAFTANQLRRMCLARSIPYMDLPSAGALRTCRLLVRVDDVVQCLESHEVKAL